MEISTTKVGRDIHEIIITGSISLGVDVAADIYVKGTITNGVVYCYNDNTIYDVNYQPFNKPAVTPSGPIVWTIGGT